VKALRQAGCKRIFEEKASGGRWDRPQLHKALEQLRERDVLVVWKLDRLSRSLKDLLHIMERVRDAGAGFRSITEAVDTTTSAGRMVMQMLGSFAEFERSMVRERTRAGLAAARPRGVKVRTTPQIEPSSAGRDSGLKFSYALLVSITFYEQICFSDRTSP
jgi:DNA invertase Pin-like site-specific DNA recombinase